MFKLLKHNLHSRSSSTGGTGPATGWVCAKSDGTGGNVFRQPQLRLLYHSASVCICAIDILQYIYIYIKGQIIGYAVICYMLFSCFLYWYDVSNKDGGINQTWITCPEATSLQQKHRPLFPPTKTMENSGSAPELSHIIRYVWEWDGETWRNTEKRYEFQGISIPEVESIKQQPASPDLPHPLRRSVGRPHLQRAPPWRLCHSFFSFFFRFLWGSKLVPRSSAKKRTQRGVIELDRSRSIWLEWYFTSFSRLLLWW